MLFNPQTIQATAKFPTGATVTEFTLSSNNNTVIFPDRSADSRRRGALCFNAGTASAFISIGTTISATLFTAEILPGGFFSDDSGWQGSIVARSVLSTKVNCTEITII